MSEKTAWTISGLIGDEHLKSGSKLLKRAGKDDYPREANWVHLLANAIERENRTTLLEAPYWRAYKPRPTAGWPKVDLWIPKNGTEREAWIEVKIAELRRDRPRSIGNEPAQKILELWATDIWRLLVCTQQVDTPSPIHCGLIIYAWGERPLVLSGARKAKRTNADKIYAQLMDAAVGENPTDDFLSRCTKYFNVNISKSVGQLRVISIEWDQPQPATAAFVEDWGRGARELV